MCCGNVKAQNFALKTNILYDATATVNIGAEIGLAPKWTFDLSGNYNPWEMPNGMLWKHAMIQPEFRYWFCDRFSRHFLGFHGIGGIMYRHERPSSRHLSFHFLTSSLILGS